MGRRGIIVLLAAGAATVAAVRAAQRTGACDRYASSMRTSSSPGAGLYDLAGRLLRPLYDELAAEAASLLDGVETPLVLEIGPGPGEAAVRLARLLPDVDITGLDVDPAMTAIAGARAAREGVGDRVRFLVGDVASIPFEAASFDLVFSSFSAHHWERAADGFAEIRRVLRPGGRALVFDLPDGWGHFETGAGGLASVAARGGFEDPSMTVLRWPLGLPFIRRLTVARDRAAGDPASTASTGG